MNLKKLIKEVERIKKRKYTEDDIPESIANQNKLQGIKQTVEAVDKELDMQYSRCYKDWQTLKKLLGIK